jgi:hypothetical protein
LGAELEFLRELSLQRTLQPDQMEKLALGDVGESSSDTDIGFMPTLNLDLGASMTKYIDNPSLDKDLFANFNGGFIPDVDFQYKLGKGKNKLLLRQTIHPSIESLSSIQVGGQGQISLYQSDSGIEWEQSFNRIGYNLGYDRSATYYESSNKDNNYLDQSFKVGTFMQAFPKTRFFVETQLGRGEYTEAADNQNDVDYWKTYFGVQGNLSKKTVGIVKAGYQYRDYKSGNQLNEPFVEANLNYDYSPKTKLSMRLSRDSREGYYAADGFDENYTAAFGAKYIINSRLNADLDILEYMHDKYESGRKDDTYSSTIGLNYIFRRWMTMTLSVTHIQRDSTNSEAAYDNNKCTLSLKAEF